MIDLSKEVVGFQLANNTNSAYNINLTNGAGFSPQYSVNATTKHQWTIDVSTWNTINGNLYIFSGTSQNSYYLENIIPYTGDANATITSIINSLNTFNLGLFTYTLVSGTTYEINVFNNIVVFGDIGYNL
jgi:hypothetical protein